MQIQALLDKMDRIQNKNGATFIPNYATSSKVHPRRTTSDMRIMQTTTPMLTEGQRNYLKELFNNLVSSV